MMSQETLFYRLINCLYGKIHDDKSWEAFWLCPFSSFCVMRGIQIFFLCV
jgi:hypothetical protein